MKKQVLKVVSVISMSNAFILLTLGEYGKYSTILFIIGFVCVLELISLKLKEKN